MQYKIYCFLFIFYTSILFAQSNCRFPENLHISSNDSSLIFDKSIRESVLDKAEKMYINYTVVGIHYDSDRVISKILVPQTFTKYKVVEQGLLYFCLLNDEKNMRRELLKIYPFFVQFERKPFVTIKYRGNGKFKVNINNWETVALPAKPTVFEAEIYNQVLDKSFSAMQSFETIPAEIFEQVAKLNDLDISVIEEIYQKVLLWQKSQ